MGPYLVFEKISESPSGLTGIHRVMTQTGSTLGEIRWYGAWRKYVFFPEPSTLYDPPCLLEIAGYVRELTEFHKQFKSHKNQ